MSLIMSDWIVNDAVNSKCEPNSNWLSMLPCFICIDASDEIYDDINIYGEQLISLWWINSYSAEKLLASWNSRRFLQSRTIPFGKLNTRWLSCFENLCNASFEISLTVFQWVSVRDDDILHFIFTLICLQVTALWNCVYRIVLYVIMRYDKI